MELDEPARALYTSVHELEYGCSLLRLFAKNKRTLLTAEDVVFHLNAPNGRVESDLDALVQSGLIRRIEVAGVTFFGRVTDSAQSRLVRDLLAWQDHWHARIAKMTHWIDGRPGAASAARNWDRDSDVRMAA